MDEIRIIVAPGAIFPVRGQALDVISDLTGCKYSVIVKSIRSVCWVGREVEVTVAGVKTQIAGATS